VMVKSDLCWEVFRLWYSLGRNSGGYVCLEEYYFFSVNKAQRVWEQRFYMICGASYLCSVFC
jgi:hypothetical protein